jgi:hypothetical protein
MDRARIIKVGTTLTTERLAEVIRKSLSIAFHELNKNAQSHDDEGERKYCMEMCKDIMDIAGSVSPPRDDTYAMLEVCTCHITEDDNSILAYMSECNVHANDAPLSVGNLGYGYAIMLVVDPEEDTDMNLGGVQAECENQGNNLSDSFWQVLRMAKAEGYRCVYFDGDVGNTIEGLPVHEW